jgi:hypothetical protein
VFVSCIYMLCLYVVLSCLGGGLCDGLITRPEESYRVYNCMCDHSNPERGPMFQAGSDRKMNKDTRMLQMVKTDTFENMTVFTQMGSR